MYWVGRFGNSIVVDGFDAQDAVSGLSGAVVDAARSKRGLLNVDVVVRIYDRNRGSVVLRGGALVN
mgnify:CR=1 FL=1